MRIKKEIKNISYNDTHDFFDTRAKKFNNENPYAVTMYQDNNPELVKKRNDAEVERLKPLLKIDNNSKILDVACGIGRWSDAITEEVQKYCGIDFCAEFVELAKKRNKHSNRKFYVSSSVEVEQKMEEQDEKNFNRVLLIGALMYLNDSDVKETLKQIEKLCDDSAIICIREPIGIEERLTLKDQFSEELKDDYNAIYRTRGELENIFENTLCQKGFAIKENGFMFPETDLNNRKETTQYYWIIER